MILAHNFIKMNVVLCLIALNVSFSVADEALEEIIVTASADKYRALQTSTDLDSTTINSRAASNFTGIIRIVSGVGIRTNSRGEAVLRLRGSEERQSQVFLDGAPMSVAWDGRADLNLIPSVIISHVSILKSAAPIEFGAGAVFGVVDISTFSRADNFTAKMRGEFGSLGHQFFEALVRIPSENSNFTFAASYRSRSGEVVASSKPIPFDILLEKGRTNTALTNKTIFASFHHQEEWGSLKGFILHVKGVKEIAAAAHIDPAKGKVRFWRYPKQALTQVAVNADIDVSDISDLKLTSWLQYYNQQIDAYKDITYQDIKKTQNDQDKTFGMRLTLNNHFDDFTLRFVNSYQGSEHRKVFDHSGGKEVFNQQVFSLGMEIDIQVNEDVNLSISSAYDHSSMPLTGGRKAQNALSNWAASLTLNWQVNDEFLAQISAGKRTRFPTMRETYGTALGQFLLNPDLKAETVFSLDLSLIWSLEELPIKVIITPWFSSLKGTLSRRRVKQNGQRFRQRYNLKGSEGYGIETSLEWKASDSFKASVQLAWQNLSAFKDERGFRPSLLQRPSLQWLIDADINIVSQLNVKIELSHISGAKDENEQEKTIDLGSSLELNLMTYYSLSKDFEIYLRADNISNSIILPQLGLPQEGRRFRAGVRVNF